MKSWVLAAIAAASIAAPASAQTFAAVTSITGGSLSQTNPNLTYGFAFTVNQTFEITALGYYDSGADGLTGAHIVGLYDSTGNTLLTSGTVQAGTASTLSNGYRYAPVAYTLNAGSYVLAGTSVDIDTYLSSPTAVGTAPGLTLNGGRIGFGSTQGVLSPPNSAVGSALSYQTVNFQYFDASAPEPASWAMMLGGFAVIGGAMRTRRRKLVQVA